MPPDLHRLIAALSPETYCVPARRRAARRVLDGGLKQGDPLAVRRAAELAEPLPANDVALDQFQSRSAFDPVVLRHPLERHSLTYDNLEDSLEALYFTLLDHLEGHGWHVAKLVDQLNSSAGSGLGGDLARRAMKAQQEAARLLEASHELLEKILRRVERIKELENQLAALSTVGSPPLPDLQPGRDQAVEASLQEGLKTDAPHRLPFTAAELRMRLDIERGQLRAQMDLLRLQARWAQPWLRAAEELREHGPGRAGLVTAFNTARLDVVLLARRELPVEELIRAGDLPRFIAKAAHRNYTPAVLVELRLRSAPRGVAAGTHVHRGRVEAVFTSYALHDEEVATLQTEVERDEVGRLLSATGQQSIQAAERLLRDIEKLLDGKPSGETPRGDTNVNPFAALWSLLGDLWGWLVGRQPPESSPGLVADSTVERVLRSQSVLLSRRDCLELFGATKLLTRAVSPCR